MSKQTLICKDLIQLIGKVGNISNVIMMKDIIKFGENESFKDTLRTYLEEAIELLSNTTQFYQIPYIQVPNENNTMQIELLLERLLFNTTQLVTNIIDKRRDEKKVERYVNNIVFYIKMISDNYNINYTKFVKRIEDYSLNNE